MPQASAVWSADPRQMWTFPARFLVEFFANHGMLGFAKRPQWRTIVGGSRSLRGRDHARRCGICGSRRRSRSITRDEDRVTSRRAASPSASTRSCSRRTPTRRCGCSASATDREHEILGAIPYQPNEAVLHTDRRLLPRRRRAWASWNYHLLPEPTGMTTVTYHMNRLQALDADREFCVTLNRSDAIDPGKVLRTILLRAPGVHRRRRPRPGALAEISGVNRTHYAGAYWGWGFHEDGVVSARARRRALRGAPVMYAGTIRHRRFAVREHAFKYRIALAYRELGDGAARVPVARGGAASSPAPAATSACSRTRSASTRSASTTASTATTLRWIVAEVTNTPWGEKHAYVLGPRGGTIDKEFHVSPFMAHGPHLRGPRDRARRDALDAHRVATATARSPSTRP